MSDTDDLISDNESIENKGNASKRYRVHRMNKCCLRGYPGITAVAQDPTVIIGSSEIVSTMSGVIPNPRVTHLRVR